MQTTSSTDDTSDDYLLGIDVGASGWARDVADATKAAKKISSPAPAPAPLRRMSAEAAAVVERVCWCLTP